MSVRFYKDRHYSYCFILENTEVRTIEGCVKKNMSESNSWARLSLISVSLSQYSADDIV